MKKQRSDKRDSDVAVIAPEPDKLAPIFRRSMFWTPERQAPSAWVEHVPFAFWLVDALRPATIVELGTYNGVSYSAMCQAVRSLVLPTRCFAVDTWKGDEHAGFYPEEVYRDFATFHDQHYSAFSRLVRSTFDEALPYFEDRSIDLLHIDGLHTYDAARHDYDSWLPKLSPDAVIIFHDTNVREDNFGIFRLWSEIASGRQHFNFLHGHGLGVLGLGHNYSNILRFFFDANDDGRLVSSVREIFASRGRSARLLYERSALDQALAERDRELAERRDALTERDANIAVLDRMLVEREAKVAVLDRVLAERDRELGEFRDALTARDANIAVLDQTLAEREAKVAVLDQALAERDHELGGFRHAVTEQGASIVGLQSTISALQASTSWRITAPLRFIKRLLGRFRDSAVGYSLTLCWQVLRTRSRAPLRDWRATRAIARSGLFDRDWYIMTNPDVAAFGIDPVRHYVAFGAREGRDPSPLFDTDWYLAQYPDVAASGVNPLVHFIIFGIRERRLSNPNFIYEPTPPPTAESGAVCGVRQPSLSPAHRANVERWYDEADPEVSIVVLNWNNSALTIQCLQELWANTTDCRYEIIVVDNGSDLKEFLRLEALSGRFRLLRLGVNRYFGEGNNLGAQQANGQFLVFLNNDAFVTPGWLKPLRNVFEQYADAGASGPKFLYPDGRLQEAGACINDAGEAVQIGKFESPDNEQYNELSPVSYCSAACLMIRRSVFEQVLGFDLCWEPAYYEDVDLCLKVALLGLKTYYCPTSTILHIEHATTGDRRTGLGLENNIVAINRGKFTRRWGDWLRGGCKPEHLFPGPRPVRGRSTTGLRVGLFTPYALIPGGGEMYLLSLAESFLPDAEVTLITPESYSRVRLLTMARELTLDLDRLSLATLQKAQKMAEFDLFIAMSNSVLPPIAGLGKRNVHVCQFPFPIAVGQQRQLASGYEFIAVYSEFVRSHTTAATRRLQLPEKPIHVISPPVNLVDRANTRKKNLILSVGRIFTGDHCKRHDLMIEVFRNILARGYQGIELHIAGSLHPESRHREYFVQLQEMARGLPVFFHLNTSRQELEKLYRSALVYWHAAGIGVDITASPEKCEHFGITVVEAMSAGCIAVVADQGGPAELVDHTRTGFHFRDGSELAELTGRILTEREEPWVTAMAAAAADQAQVYAKANFVRAWRLLLDMESAPARAGVGM